VRGFLVCHLWHRLWSSRAEAEPYSKQALPPSHGEKDVNLLIVDFMRRQGWLRDGEMS